MSELIKNNKNHNIRWKLLTEASALVLMGYVATTPAAKAGDGDRPIVWIEVGGQFSRLQDSQEIYSPPFVDLTPSIFPMPQADERPPRYGFDESGSILFQPEGSNWHFSASIRYGKSSSNKHTHHQTYPDPLLLYEINRHGVVYHYTTPPGAARFTDVQTKQSEGHTIVDFEVGKDVGLGLFGVQSESSLNLGVRFAQFQSKSRIALRENPDWHFQTGVDNFLGFVIQYALQPYHSFAGTFLADRSFSGVGPSLSWNDSTPIVGNKEEGALMLDWGINASLLFGRQKTRTQHGTTDLYHTPGYGPYPYPIGFAHPTTVYHHAPPPQSRSRSVIVPNIGGFAGLSVKYPNVKVNFGYKADFFFGAMDGGIDVRRTEDVGFHGPYASVSIGLGG